MADICPSDAMRMTTVVVSIFLPTRSRKIHFSLTPKYDGATTSTKYRKMKMNLMCLLNVIHSCLNGLSSFSTILCLISRTPRDVTERAQGYTLQDASFMRQSRCSFLNVWENTQVARAMTNVFVWNTHWHHGRSRGETKYRNDISTFSRLSKYQS